MNGLGALSAIFLCLVLFCRPGVSASSSDADLNSIELENRQCEQASRYDDMYSSSSNVNQETAHEELPAAEQIEGELLAAFFDFPVKIQSVHVEVGQRVEKGYVAIKATRMWRSKKTNESEDSRVDYVMQEDGQVFRVKAVKGDVVCGRRELFSFISASGSRKVLAGANKEELRPKRK